jgi:hypothetical protein
MIVNPTVLADRAAAAESEQPSEPPANGSAPVDAAAPRQAHTDAPASEPAAPARPCANCGAALEDGQDWCLQCGAVAPGSLDAGGPSWRSATIVLAATAVLVLGAAAAAYAALTRPGPHTVAPKVITVAQAPTATTTPGAASTPGVPTTPGTATTPTGALGTPTTIKPHGGTSSPPKIPLTAPTPKSSGTTPASTTPSTGTGSGESETGTTKSSTKPSGGTPEPTPILLDTNAASTYNPYGYPASGFGDPSLAIDGETSTGWTALLNPAVAPKMAQGLAIDLKTGQRVGELKLITSTPGMTVQVYGANGNTLPASITDPAWIALSSSLDARKRTTKIKLRDSTKPFRFITLWIGRAPASAVGTPQAPGHVSVNELELFAAE